MLSRREELSPKSELQISRFGAGDFDLNQPRFKKLQEANDGKCGVIDSRTVVSRLYALKMQTKRKLHKRR